jgi:hypothetical protein
MAISSLIVPTGYQSVQDSLWNIAVSDASGLTNFKYVFDIYDSNDNHLIRSKIYPDVNNGNGYFDAGSVIRNQISYDWFTNAVTAGNNYLYCGAFDSKLKIEYDVSVGEEYNVGASGITNIALRTETATAYNYFPALFQRRVKTIDDKYGNYLSNRPNYANTSYGEKLFIPFNRSGSVSIVVKKYGENNNLISTNSKTRNLTSAQFHQLDLGMTAINNEFATTIFNATDEGYYTIEFDGKLFRVNIKCVTDYKPINLHFMNAYGMFETARFDCTNKLNMNLTRKAYEKKDVVFNSASVDYYDSNNVYNETKINYGSDINWTYKLMMNYPTDAEYDWLVELIYSPQIYMELDGYYYPVSIKTSSYEYSKQIFAKLKTFEVEVDLNQKRNGFRR